MGSWLSTEVGLGLLRTVLVGAGMSLVTDGFISKADLTTIVGAALTLVVAVMSAISNRNKAKANAIVAAVNDHPDISVIPANQSVTGKPIVIVAPEFPTPSLSSGGAK